VNIGSPRIRVAVVQTTPQSTSTIELSLPTGATVADALQGVAGTLGAGPVRQWSDNVGIFGQRCALHRVLRDGDRVEIYRPLAMDAKSARRVRASAAPVPPAREKGRR